MQRRGFLTGLAGTVGWLAAGQRGVAGVQPAPVYQHAVGFIPTAEAASVRSAFVIDAAATAAHQRAVFQQSVASGDPNPNGAVIWTRVDGVALGQQDGSVAWQISSDDSFADASVVLEGVAAVLGANDYTVSLPIQNTALSGFTQYYYRFIFNGIVSRTGRFKTLPLPGAALGALRIGFVVCQDYSNGFYNAYAHLANEPVDVVLFLGDYIYEYLDDGVGGPDNGPVRVVPPYPLGGQYPQGLRDYRHLYKVYRADPDIQAAHENFAFISLWDDHEFFNDCHQDFHEDTNPPGVTATTPQPLLRRAATKAWTEYSLAAVPFQPNRNFLDEIKVYRSFSYGGLVDLVVTDERLYRDGPPCGDAEAQRYETPGCPAQYTATRTMLGATQKAWFLDKMTTSQAAWKLWANEVMLAQYKFGPPLAPVEVFFDLDEWDGYPAERAEILGTIEAAGVQNFVALSGDAHLFMTSYLKTDYDDPNVAPMGVELMVGAVSSGNYRDAGVDQPGAKGTAPKSSPVAARRMAARDLPPDSLSAFVLANNPHMQFWNGSTWGYGVVTITAQQLVCNFASVEVKHRGAPVAHLVTYTVPSGQVALIRS